MRSVTAFLTWRRWASRPQVALQDSPTDCGFVCIAALLAMYRRSLPIHQIKALVGSTTRGLTLSQMRDAMRRCGLNAEAVAFDTRRIGAYPSPGTVLLKRGHYVVIGRTFTRAVDVFDPAIGWQRWSLKRLVKEVQGLGVEVKSVGAASQPSTATHPSFWKVALTQARSALGRRAIFLTLAAQGAMLSIPLITQQSVDRSIGNQAGTPLSMMGLAFMLMMVIGSLTQIAAAWVSRVLAKRVQLATVGRLYDQLAQKSTQWLENHTSSHSYNLYSASIAVQSFYTEFVSRIASIVLMAVVGVAAMWFLSPWLVLPGLATLLVSVLLDLAFQSALQAAGGTVNQARIRHRHIFYDVLPLLPAIARFGGFWRARVQLRHETRRLADAEMRRAALSSARGAIGSFAKALDHLAFVCIAGYFVQKENASLGIFVAAGLYKDQLVQALSTLFNLRQQYVMLAPQRAQLVDLMADTPTDSQPPVTAQRGAVLLERVSFRHGELDPLVLTDVSLEIAPGQCLVICGPSGSGKTTLAKLICGLMPPTQGRVQVDGQWPTRDMQGVGAVFQSDRLVTDTIRHNLRFYRSRFDDADYYTTLDAVGLGDFVRELPMRLDTIVGEGLTGLSGGQRQRLLLARALLAKPRLLVLDEATSSLDVAGEGEILCHLKRLGITIILFAHRPEVWRYADALFEMRKGSLQSLPLTERI